MDPWEEEPTLCYHQQLLHYIIIWQCTASNYGIISSFGNAQPATTALSHHLAMHRQQPLYYLIIWQCTASNYCIISSFGNTPPATTALSHHLAMHCQQLLHYNISWQCTAFPHYWSSEIIAVNKQKKLPLIFTKTFFAQVLNLLFNQ